VRSGATQAPAGVRHGTAVTLLQRLEREGVMAAADLAAAAGMSRNAAYLSLHRMAGDGRVERAGSEVRAGKRVTLWAVTRKGRCHLAAADTAGLAETCFLVLGIEDREMTAAQVTGWLWRDGEPYPPGRVRAALDWLARQRDAMVERGPAGLRLSAAGRAVTAMEEWEWASTRLCRDILADRRAGTAGMSGTVATGLLAWAGASPDEAREQPGQPGSWAVTLTDGAILSWAPAGEGWELTAGVPCDESRPERAVLVPDLTELAFQLRTYVAAATGIPVTAPDLVALIAPGLWALSPAARPEARSPSVA
jgi:DNA-binding MarR family transcriptional regulator